MQIFIKTIVEKKTSKEEVAGVVCCDTMHDFLNAPELQLMTPRLQRTRTWNFCPFCGEAVERLDGGVEEIDVDDFDRWREG